MASLATKDVSGPPTIRPGQILQFEVLESLPGRPITGEHLVRPDGTVCLGFYGDLHVAGMNRNQIKVKLIEHLRKYINDEVFGLVKEGRSGVEFIAPLDSGRVFVDESTNYLPTGPTKAAQQASADVKIVEMDGKLDRIMGELAELRKAMPHP